MLSTMNVIEVGHAGCTTVSPTAPYPMYVLPSAGCSTGTAKKTESRRSSLADEHARRTESDEKSEI
jgi:hypothetical protein